MKPSLLKTGDRVVITPYLPNLKVMHGVFIRRVPRQCGRAAYSIIRVDEFAGLRGADDLGDAQFSDHAISRRVELAGTEQ